MNIKSSPTVMEPRLAWSLWQGLEELSNLLWKRYGDDFVKLAEEEDPGVSGLEDDLEVPF